VVASARTHKAAKRKGSDLRGSEGAVSDELAPAADRLAKGTDCGIDSGFWGDQIECTLLLDLKRRGLSIGPELAVAL
jgi:hypothetical protein